MLTSLAIRDVVLIERLDLALGPGLTVLTGETGAGKSIVLDALGLALGARGERGLLRRGAARGSVVAGFAPPPDHPARALLVEQGLGPVEPAPAGTDLTEAGEILLRRTLEPDGKTRAFVDATPVPTQVLRRLGLALVAVHGQHDTHGLLDSARQRELLDAFAGAAATVAELRAAWRAWRSAEARRAELAGSLERARAEIEYLRHRAEELEALAAKPEEETRLAEQRARLQGRERLAAALEEVSAALGGSLGARERLGQAERRLERVRALGGERVEAALAALGRAQIELDEAESALEAERRAMAGEGGGLESVETRLFQLRDAARKYRVAVAALPALLASTREELARLDGSEATLAAATRDAAAAEAAFREATTQVRAMRTAAAGALVEAVAAELPPLRLGRARFRVALEPLAESDWGAEGGERVRFEVATNPGQPFAPLARIASGGELARLMLALEVVLARLDPTPTLIFDEIDAGIGGATADAVGERLARLAHERQVLVVTHSPQVAARASRHLLVRKEVEEATARIELLDLDPAGRRQEIARMLAGAEVTKAAQAAAASLLELSGRA